MIPNFKEILSELSYRVDGGIPDLNKESHVNILIDILRENGVSDAAHLAQRARVYFSYLNEATPKKGDAGLEAAAEKFKNKKYKNSKGGEVSFATAINYGYKGKDNDSAHIQAMNDLETFVGDSDGKYGTMEKPKQPDEPSQNIFGKDKGGKVFEPEAPAEVPTTKRTTKTEPTSKVSTPNKSKKVKKVNDEVRQQDNFNTDKTMVVGLDDAQSEAKTKANKAKKINTKPLFTPKDIQTIFDGKPKFPKKYLKVVERIMQYGPENVSITMLTDKAGAGTLPSTCGEIIGMVGLSIQDPSKRKQFFDTLRNRAIENGKEGIVDVSWINAGEAHCAASDRKMKRDFPNGYTILNTFWDVPDEAKAAGVENYKQTKGFSTDVNMLVMDNKTKETKWIEPSLKKDEAVNLLNGTTNRIRSIAVLASKKVSNQEKDQYELATKELEALGEVKKGKTPEWARKEELQKFVASIEDRVKDEIPKDANAEQATAVQQKLHETTWGNENVIKESKKLLSSWSKLTPKEKKDKTFEIIKGMGQNPSANLVNEVLNTLNTLSKNQNALNTKDGLYGLGKILGTGKSRDIQKASIIMMNLASASGAPLLSASRSKIYKNSSLHSKAACEYLLSTNENKTALLRSIREAFPIKSLLDGEENMFLGDNKKGKTPGTNIDQFVLRQVFGVNSADEFQAGLKIFETPPPPHISYLGKGKNSKPIEIAIIKSRSDGKGYGGTWKLEMSLSKSFVDLCKQYDT